MPPKDILDSLSKTKRLQYDLMQEVEKLRFEAHARFLSEHEIVDRFSLNRTTVRQAIAALVEDGYLYRINGKGTFISPPSKQSHILIVSNYGDDTIRKGRYAIAEFLGGITQYIADTKTEYLWFSITPAEFMSIANDLRLIYKRLAGIIFYSDIQALQETKLLLRSQRIPFMYYGSDQTAAIAGDDFATFTYSQEEVVTIAMDHLWERGHRNIGVVATLRDYPRLQRFDEYQRFFQKKGLVAPKEGEIQIRYNDIDHPETKYQDFKEQLEADPPHKGIDAFLCLDDSLALYFINTVIRLGYNIPKDFSVIGISNYPFCSDVVVPLTSVEIPFSSDGKRVFATFVEHIEKRNEIFHLRSETRLIRRESSR